MREIVLDTETTGLDPLMGHRLVEIGCVELVNHLPTGRHWHTFINPQRDMPNEAYEVHGLSEHFLSDKPLFEAICDEFLAFIGDAPLIIHNGAFDMGFLNAELQRCKRLALPMERLVCTLELARKRFSGGSNSLDSLCRRFGIDLSVRTKHGAIVDCELLAEVYLELCGGRQPGFLLGATGSASTVIVVDRPHRPARPHAPSDDELAAHAAFIEKLSDPLWRLA
ncbi:DNA polymerase-3 subunit epsilon [Constrictibacter sp. MBR-5]|jgi:DNA polymerase-3 subunit epsilon|uniref:DNA polymerase III subunit epsilon n=1 Tax=Constrictibacter sp. MBR-5 TaxID=3156467 RepID=UPI0033969655